MAEEYFMVKPEEFQQLVQYYKGQITDSALLNKAGRVAAKEHCVQLTLHFVLGKYNFQYTLG